jgi:hypothetical protein
MDERNIVVISNRLTTFSASASRSRPWSTKTQVSCSSIASRINTAVTAESTPPESPQITLPPPTSRRTLSIASSLKARMVQSPAQPAAMCARNCG